MLIRKFLKAGDVEEVNTAAQFIKVINCESELRVRATNGAEIIVDTVARAGFEMQTAQAFSVLELTAEQPQKVELWVSKHKLSYDALTKGSNSNQSSLIEHFGGSQKVLPFESNRKAITLFSDREPFWYGGEGVTVENGIPVPVGTTKKIEGAGELHIAINKKPEMLPNGVHNILAVAGGSSYSSDTVGNVNAAGDCIYFMSYVNKKVYFLRGGVIREVVTKGFRDIEEPYTSAVRGERVYFAWNDGRISGVEGGRVVVEYYASVSGSLEAIGVVNSGLMVLGLRSSAGNKGISVFNGVEHKYTFNTGSASTPRVFVDESGRVFIYHNGVYVFDSVADIPELKADAVVTGGYLQFSWGEENENFVLLRDGGSNPKATAINKKTGAVVAVAMNTSQICTGQDGYLYAFSEGGLQRSDDGSKWVTVVSGLIDAGYAGSMAMAGADMALFPKTKGRWKGVEFSHYEMSPQKNVPKAKIRMLKEVV